MSLKTIALEVFEDIFRSIEPIDHKKLEADAAREAARRAALMFPCDCPDHAYNLVNQGRFLTPYESDRRIEEAIAAVDRLKW